jgi:hypothetical protein
VEETENRVGFQAWPFAYSGGHKKQFPVHTRREFRYYCVHVKGVPIIYVGAGVPTASNPRYNNSTMKNMGWIYITRGVEIYANP